MLAAYHTLRECQENKEMLGEKISETRLKIGDKRKHLEELRGELKILGKRLFDYGNIRVVSWLY